MDQNAKEIPSCKTNITYSPTFYSWLLCCAWDKLWRNSVSYIKTCANETTIGK